MTERIELINLLISMTEDELKQVISRAERELDLRLPGEREPRRPLPASPNQ